MKHRNYCDLCPELCESRKRICWGEEHGGRVGHNPRILVVAEAPGNEENDSGRTLIGASGQEARDHLNINGLSRHGVWLTNLCLCHPEGNRDPHRDEILACAEAHLIPKILELQPRLIITMGRLSTRFFLGDVPMELVHGIPRPVNVLGFETTVLPSYHPAAGMHSPEQMILFHVDMKAAGDTFKGKIEPHPPTDEWKGREVYREAKTPTDVRFALEGEDWYVPGVVAVDTEWAREKPWCLSFSVVPGKAWVVDAASGSALEALGVSLASRGVRTAIHNSLYDIPVLAQMGIEPARIDDTMVMAYLLQSEPQGLKPLAFRHLGMEMSAYQEMVGARTREMALDYLETVASLEWPDPEPVLEWRKGEPHVRQPQNITRKVSRLLTQIAEGQDVDPWSRWRKMDGTEQVVDLLGPLREADLSDIPRAEAIHYSARDADATIRLYPLLMGRIKSMGLEDTFRRDMRAVPMVVDMMANGMPVSLQAFKRLSQYFQEWMDTIAKSMQKMVGHHLQGQAISPLSYPQMSRLIYDVLRLPEKGGRFRAKKGGNKSTANDILSRYLGLHPIVAKIIEWRQYQKLKTSYADTIPKKIESDGRVRTTLRITRVATGRLSSSDPNLMAQPVRSEEGRMVRDCYEAEEGNVLVSGDYAQVEMRVAASESKDPKMLRIFHEGLDIHSMTASDMFGVPVSDLDEMKHRYPAKRVGFGILNLISAQGLQRELAVSRAGDWTVADCEDMIQSWFQIYSGIAAYMKRNGEMAKRRGYVRDCWGRIRYIPGIRSTNKWIRIEAERQAGNAPIQMGAQGVIKEAMGQLVPVYRPWDGEVRPLIQIHDDIVWEMAEPLIPVVIPEIKAVMESVGPKGFQVPLDVDFKVGKKWGSMKSWTPTL